MYWDRTEKEGNDNNDNNNDNNNNNKYTKQGMHNTIAHHSLTDA